MSLSPVSSVALALLPPPPSPSTTPARSPASVSSDSTDTGTLTKDLAALFKALASGDIAAAQKDVATVQSVLRSQTTTPTNSFMSPSPLDNLLQAMADSLKSGSTTSSLQDLATFLLRNGQATGNLVDTSA